jgi:F0F1-type ATP synthase alpha subunit
MKTEPHELSRELSQTMKVLERVVENHRPEAEVQEVGTVTYVGPGVIRLTGLSNVQSEELLRFTGGRMGMAFNLDRWAGSWTPKGIPWTMAVPFEFHNGAP